MPTIAITDQEAFSDIEFPLQGTRLELIVDFATDVPEAAYGRFLATALRSLADRAEAGKASLMELEEGESSPGEIAADAENWRVPEDLHMKSAKAAHRFITAIAALEERGPAPRSPRSPTRPSSACRRSTASSTTTRRPASTSHPWSPSPSEVAPRSST